MMTKNSEYEITIVDLLTDSGNIYNGIETQTPITIISTGAQGRIDGPFAIDICFLLFFQGTCLCGFQSHALTLSLGV